MNYQRSSFLFVWVALLCIGFTGCGTGSKSSSSSVASPGSATPTPGASAAPASLTFGSQALNSTSPEATATLTNTGTEALSIRGVTASGNFAETTACPSSLPAGASCTVSVTFTPTATGTLSGSLTFTDDAAASTQVVYLYGTGVNAGDLTESSTSLSLGNVTVGQSSTQAVTITNTGGESVIVTSVSTSGAGLSLSGMATPLTLGAGQSSSLNVTFAPTSSGPLNGAVHLTDNSPTPNVTISVSGTGVAALSPQVTLSWSESSSGVSGYNVYRSLVTGGSYTKLNPSLVKATSYTDQNVTAGNTYFYVFTSVGTNNAESGYSAQVEAIVP
jgi:hypothetical protein